MVCIYSYAYFLWCGFLLMCFRVAWNLNYAVQVRPLLVSYDIDFMWCGVHVVRVLSPVVRYI
jgi:hypothetical protein